MKAYIFLDCCLAHKDNESEPGQYALAYLPGVVGGRAYSMSNTAGDGRVWEFQVRRVPGGHGSAMLFDGATPGQRIESHGVAPKILCLTPRMAQSWPGGRHGQIGTNCVRFPNEKAPAVRLCGGFSRLCKRIAGGNGEIRTLDEALHPILP